MVDEEHIIKRRRIVADCAFAPRFVEAAGIDDEATGQDGSLGAT